MSRKKVSREEIEIIVAELKEVYKEKDEKDESYEIYQQYVKLFSISYVYNCIEKDDVKRLEEINIVHGVNMTDSNLWDYGHSPLGLAIWKGKKRLTELFVEAGFNLNEICNNWDETPFEVAIKYGHDEIALYLVENGADVFCNPEYLKREEIKSPLHFAVMRDNFDLVKILLIKGIDPNIKDKEGEIPLYYAKSESIIRLLLEYGSNDINWFDLKDYGKGIIKFRGPVKINNISYKDQNVFVNDKRSSPKTVVCYLTIYKIKATCFNKYNYNFVLLLEDIRNPKKIKNKKIPFLCHKIIHHYGHTSMDQVDSHHEFGEILFAHEEIIDEHPMSNDIDVLHIMVANKYIIRTKGVSYDNYKGKIIRYEVDEEDVVFDN